MDKELKTGDSIPSMRALARNLKVAVITVQKAYENLQKDGFIETIHGKGSFISARNIELQKIERYKEVEDLAKKIIKRHITIRLPFSYLLCLLHKYMISRADRQTGNSPQYE